MATTAAATSDDIDHPPGCLNCGARLIGRFCHACGQSAHVHTTLTSVGHDLLHGAFHFEGRVWRTLPMLAFRPGDLTRRYIAGERARFVSPLALFLFGVVLLFAAIEQLGPPIRPQVTVERNGQRLTANQLREQLTRAQVEVGRLTGERQAAVAAGRPTIGIDGHLAGARADLAGLTSAARAADAIEHPAASLARPISTGWGGIDARIAAARANPTLALVEVEANAHKFAWLLIPVSVPFLWLMFCWRREWRLYDHVVFVTYSLAAVTLLLVAMAALGAIGLSVDWLLFLVPVHFFLQLRNAYRLSWWGAGWRTVGMMVAALVSLAVFAAIVLWVGTG